MSTSVFCRRSAERFAELLDQPAIPDVHSPASPTGARKGGHGPLQHVRSRRDAELSVLVTLTRRTAALDLTPDHGPDPAFRAELRAKLMATAKREGIGASARPAAMTDAGARMPRPVDPTCSASGGSARSGSGGRASGPLITTGRGRTRGAIVVGVAVGALALSGMSAASGDATPGDPLYGVKRSAERAQLAFTGSDVTRGQLYLEFARNRLGEAIAVYRNPDSLGRLLNDMDSDARQGVKLLITAAVDRRDPGALDAVDAFVTSQQHGMTRLLDRVGDGSRGRLLDSLDLLARVATRSQLLRETLSCSTPSDGGDALGPKPRVCTPAGSSAAGGVSTEQSSTSTAPARQARPSSVDPTTAPPTPKPSPTSAAASAPAPVARATAQPVRKQSPTPDPTDDSGLLDGLNRIVEGLLGD